MKHGFACILAIAGWYLLYPPVTHQGDRDFQASLSKWEIDSSYSSAAGCRAARMIDLNNAMLELHSGDVLGRQ
jgi:hypothetical protein